jgi:enoyl-CoA hydratase/carnithine racemase
MEKRAAATGNRLMFHYQHWLIAEDSHIATLTLHRPQANNSLTLETLSELRLITADLNERDEVWAVIVEGSGDHFSAGVDTSIIQGMLDQPEEVFREQLREMQLALDEFEAIQKPTLAKLKGFCIGGGLLLALCCDFRIASQRTIFALPEVKLGIAVLMGTHRISRVIGMAAAKELVLLGDRFNAQTAYTLGLVHKVVPPDQLDAAVASLADKFYRLPPRTIGVAKRILNEGYHLPLRDSEDLEIDAQAQLLHDQDLREAIESYLAKREPHFTGR